MGDDIRFLKCTLAVVWKMDVRGGMRAGVCSRVVLSESRDNSMTGLSIIQSFSREECPEER